MNFDIL